MPKIKCGARTGSPLGTIRYIEKSAKKVETGTHQLLSSWQDLKGIEREMLDNQSSRGKRAYYHDSVSFHPEDRKKCNEVFMRYFSERYVKRHYYNQQVYWGVHREKEHIHVHFCVSATDIDGEKLQLSGKFMRDRDEYVQRYASARGLHNMQTQLRFKKGDEKLERLKKNRGVKPKKEVLQEKIERVVNDSSVRTKADFKRELEKEGLQLSKRETGIESRNRIYRFQTLGFDKYLYKMAAFKDSIQIRRPLSNNSREYTRDMRESPRNSELDIVKDKKKTREIGRSMGFCR